MSLGGFSAFAGRVGRNLAFKTLTEIAGRLLSFLFYMALARWLGAGQFGLFSLVNSVGAIAVFLVDPGVNITFIRSASRAPGHLENTSASILGLKLALSFLTVTACVVYGALAGYDAYMIGLLGLMGAQMAGFALMEFAGAIFQAREEMWAETFLLSVGRTAVVIIAIGALALGAGVGMTLLAMTVTQGVAVVWAFAWTVKRGVPLTVGFDVLSWGGLLRDSVPLGAASFFTVLFYRVDVAMAPFLGVTLPDLGFYSAGVKILDVALSAPSLFYAALFPTLSALVGGDRRGFVKWADRSLAIVTAGGIVVAMAGILFSREIITFIFTESFAPAERPMKLLFVASAVMFARHGLMMTLLLDNRTRQAVSVAVVTVVLNVVFNLVLTPQFGLMGMAGAKLGSDIALVGMAGYLWMLRRKA
jgi:O-antigen/teichoic acid export membrane protein